MIRFSKTSWICLVLLAIGTLAMLYLNSYVLEMTHGCYNAIEILFL